MLNLPSRSGWMVEWETGRVSKKGVRFTDTYESTSKEKVEAKKKELEKEGFKIKGVYECIF